MVKQKKFTLSVPYLVLRHFVGAFWKYFPSN